MSPHLKERIAAKGGHRATIGNRPALFAAILLLFPAIALSQSIKGTVVDEGTRRPLGLVNVILKRLPDSTLVTGAATDTNGIFLLSKIPRGTYVLQLALIGYESKQLPAFAVDSAAPERDMGTISLHETPVSLEAVEVTAEKALMNLEADRKIYNVDQDILGKSASASEVLRNIPSVEVDVDGNVSLRGSSSVLLMMNGKTTPLLRTNAGEALQQIPANSIERIEVITNPSAKYTPEGASGIINLVLKRKTDEGLKGSLGLNAGMDDRYNGNLRLAYGDGGLNLFLNYSPRKNNRNRNDADVRTQIGGPTSTTLTYYNQNVASSYRPMSHLLTVGAELTLDSTNTTGVSGNYYHNQYTRYETAHSVIEDFNMLPTSEYERNRISDEEVPLTEVSAFYQHNFGQAHKLRLEVKESVKPEEQDIRFTNVYLLPRAINGYDNARYTQKSAETEASLDYSNPVSDHSTFEAGLDASLNSQDDGAYSESYDTLRRSFVNDPSKTNQFTFDEKIVALYATYRQSFGAFGFLAGLRGERAFTEPDLVSSNLSFSNDYNALFPSLHLSYKLSDAAEMRASYSRRTHRPDAEDLNPFPQYIDPRNLAAGNPYLLPEYIHSFELGCNIDMDRVSFVPTVYYRYRYNRFTSVTQIVNDSTLLTTTENLAIDRTPGAELVISGKAADFLTTNLSINVYRSAIDASNLGYTDNRSTMTGSGSLLLNFTLQKATMLQVSSNYHASRLTPQGETSPSYTVNIGLRREFWDRRLSLVFTASDIFNTRRRETELTTPVLYQDVVNLRDSRVLYLGLMFNFGSESKKSREKPLEYDEDQ
jgi:outer membrane receptor protein involved in Fe transport